MEWIVRAIPESARTMVIVLLLTLVGNSLRNRDANNTGADDAAGNICLAMAPAVGAMGNNNESAFKKAIRVLRDTCSAYLQESP